MEQNTFTTKNAEETQQKAEEFAKGLQPGDVVLLYGNLGSGKTTFTQGLAKGLGIQRRIISPTFTIIRSYDIRNKSSIKKMYHIDLYRVETEEDLESTGIYDIVKAQDSIVVIEWPEKLGGLTPKHKKEVHFTYINDHKRKIVIKR